MAGLVVWVVSMWAAGGSVVGLGWYASAPLLALVGAAMTGLATAVYADERRKAVS